MRKQAGFTLIELIVVIFMIGMVAGALILNFRSGDKQKRVNLSRDTIITAMRTAQNYALAGRQIPPASQAPFVRGNPRCTTNNNAAVSYWVEFPQNSNSFQLMAQDTCGAVMSIQTYNLIQKTQFAANNPFTLNTGAGAGNNTALAIRFTPPFGVMTATTATTPVGASFSAFVAGTAAVTFNDGTRNVTVTFDGISGKIE